MNWKQQLKFLPISWFHLAMIGIFLCSLFLRFWQLGQFNQLVFDEVYYAKFANNYLTGTSFFNSHPPLSQYIIAIGIWIGSHFPASPDLVNNLTGSLRSTISYRWLNAFTGSFIPLIVAGIAYQLTRRQSYAVIVAIFAATDGLFLVESRYALNNIYLIILGLLGNYFFLIYINSTINRQWLLIMAGFFLGSSAAIKWNGLSFLLGLYFLLAVARLGKFLLKILSVNQSNLELLQIKEKTPWQKLASVKLSQIVIYLLILPLFTYSLLWIPHLLMNPEYGFWEIQKQILSYHQRIGNSPEVHPYCSPWYSWLVMWRPVAYFYEKSTKISPNIQPGSQSIIYDVHAMGNPVLWWLSTGSILYFVFILLLSLMPGLKKLIKLPFNMETWLGGYIVCNYMANLLPWIAIKRCTFLYHYMGAYVFTWLALAWLIDGCLRSYSLNYRRTGWVIILLIIAAFIYWLPIYLGLPLSYQGFKMRLLFPNWI